MTDAERAVERAEKATKEPWLATPDSPGIIRPTFSVVAPGQLPVVSGMVAQHLLMENADFIAHAREDVPMLAKALAEAQARGGQVSQQVRRQMRLATKFRDERDEAQGKLEAVEALADHWRTNGDLGDRELMGKMVLAILKGERMSEIAHPSPSELAATVLALERQLREKDAEITRLTMRLREIEAMSRQGESE